MLRDSFLSLVSTLVRLLTSLVLFVVMAHAWGPQQFGVFMYPFTVAGILVKVVDYGFAVQVARDAGRAPASAGAIVARALGAKLVLVLPTLAIAGVVAVGLPRGAAYGALFALLLADALANSFGLLLIVPLRALFRFGDETHATLWANLGLFCAVAAVVLAGGGPVAAAAAFAVGRLAGVALTWRLCARALGRAPRPSFERAAVLATLRQGFPFGVHATVGTLTLQAETIMVQHYLGAGAVGIYQAGMRVLLGALLAADALNNVYLSALARQDGRPHEFLRLGTRMTRQLAALGVAAFACTIGGSEIIVRLLFRDGYAPLVPLLPFFGLLMFLRFAGVSYGTVLTLADRQAVRVAAVTGALLLGLALNALLIPRFGLSGAVASAIVGHLVLYSVYVVATWRDHRSLLADRRCTALFALAGVGALALFATAAASPLLRLQLGVAIAAAAVMVGVTRAEWGAVSGKLARAA